MKRRLEFGKKVKYHNRTAIPHRKSSIVILIGVTLLSAIATHIGAHWRTPFGFLVRFPYNYMSLLPHVHRTWSSRNNSIIPQLYGDAAEAAHGLDGLDRAHAAAKRKLYFSNKSRVIVSDKT